MIKNTNRKGFTMAEMLVCLAVISVIATILIPTLGRIKPHKEKAMFKKAYSITERVIYELVNDGELYPSTDIHAGFDNVKEVIYNDETYGAEIDESLNVQPEEGDTEEEIQQKLLKQQQYQAQTYAAKSKFCQLFAMKLNTLSPTPVCSPDTNTVSFVTTDGVQWIMPYTNFLDPDVEYYDILVDVNGDKEPNAFDEDGVEEDCQDNVDRFAIQVRADGKMRVNGRCARKYLQEMSIMH